MAETPEVIVQAADLKGETPVAVRDGLRRYELAIDFSWPPEAIRAGLQSVLRECVDSGRWTRNDTREHAEAPEERSEAAPHPESGLT
ncbi:hypothetical protein ACFW08_20025 [Streptomyces sp. NPDC058960]|uniref:hypothetical protein n=1 Tax=Streptomyces sp. NPDC058960 TaxID=3346679 RepID=UPI0036B862C0